MDLDFYEILDVDMNQGILWDSEFGNLGVEIGQRGID